MKVLVFKSLQYRLCLAFSTCLVILISLNGSTQPLLQKDVRPDTISGKPADVWHKANLTNFTSYPDPDSEECIKYNGCKWAGQFAFVKGKQPESWVKANNIVAVHSKDGSNYMLKTLRLRQGERQIDVTVFDVCSDRDCKGCCTENSKETGFLIDIEKYTMQRFGSGSGVVEWKCLDCE